MFQERICETLGEHISNKKLVAAIIRYSLRIASSSVMKKMSKETGVFDKVNFLKKEYLDYSEYVLCYLWKAVYLESKNKLVTPTFTNVHVTKVDIDFCLKYITQKDKKKLKEKYTNLNFLSISGLNENLIFRNIKGYCEVLAKNMSFLYTYDYGMTKKDIVAHLMQEAIRIYRNYEHSKCLTFVNVNREEAVEKYILKSLGNIRSNLIDYHTCNSRSRLAVENNLYKRKKQLKNKLKRDNILEVADQLNSDIKDIDAKIKNVNFFSTTYSMDVLKEDEPKNKVFTLTSPDSNAPFDNICEKTLIDSVKGKIQDSFVKKYNNYYISCKKIRDSLKRGGLKPQEIKRELIQRGYGMEEVKHRCQEEITKELAFIDAIYDRNNEFQKYLRENNMGHLSFNKMCKEAKKFINLDSNDLDVLRNTLKQFEGVL